MMVSSVKADTAGRTARNKFVLTELISTVGSYKAEHIHIYKYQI
jgi:hypothetical protein